MTDTVTRNCPWGYSCKKEWRELAPTKLQVVRFCFDCQKEVFWVDDKDDLFESIILNRCICFDPDLMQDELAEPVHEKSSTRLVGFPIVQESNNKGKAKTDPIDDFDDGMAF